MKSFKLVTLLLLLSTLFMSCEKQEYFKSESGIQKQLQYKWLRSVIAITDSPDEVWEFHDGKVTITGSNNSVSAIEGDYSVNTTLLKVFITTKNFSSGGGKDYDGAKWQVIKLDDSVLIMAADNPNGGGLLEREFTRQ